MSRPMRDRDRRPGQKQKPDIPRHADVLILPYKPDGMHAYSYFPLFQKNEHKFRQVL